MVTLFFKTFNEALQNSLDIPDDAKLYVCPVGCNIKSSTNPMGLIIGEGHDERKNI